MRRVAASPLADILMLMGVSVPLLFWRLGQLPLVLWDESRLANNALEMSRTGLDIVTTYAGLPDLWNTKPPLLIWLIAGAFSLFGHSELALRLPSAIAALFTVLAVAAACRKVTGSRYAGLGAGVILLTTVGFVGPHVARTGDYDALLTCFSTLTVIGCFTIFSGLRQDVRPRLALLLVTAMAVCGALLTKGIGGLLILPGIAFAGLASGALLKAVRYPRILIVATLPFATVAFYYVAREMTEPGYLSMVWMNELGGRYGSALEGHREPFAFYLTQLFGLWGPGNSELYLQSASPWSSLALVLLPLSLRDPQLKESARFLAVVIATFLLVISASATKIAWYVAPAYPLIAMLAAINVCAVYRRISRSSSSGLRHLILPMIFVSIAALGVRIFERNEQLVVNAGRTPEMMVAARLKQLRSTLAPRDNLRIYRDPASAKSVTSPDFKQYSPQERFYVEAMRQDGIDARFATPQDADGHPIARWSPNPIDAAYGIRFGEPRRKSADKRYVGL